MAISARALAFCFGGLLLQSVPAFAEEYPSRAVRVVTTVEPGGMADASARYLAKQLSTTLKQPYVVENRPGISGIAAAERVSNAKPDGYTLLYAADVMAIAPSMLPNLSIDVQKDLTPITLVGVAPFVFVVNPKIPVKTPTELVAYIKQNPGGFRWGIGGLGTAGQLAIERFSNAAGITAPEVPYKGNAPAAVAAMSGEVDGIAALSVAVNPLIDSGKLTGLGVASAEKVDSSPGMPTIASFGFPGYEALTWFAVWGPKDMPPELAMQVRNQVAEAVNAPDLKEEFARTGLMVSVSDSPAAFAAYFKSELERNSAILKRLNLVAAAP